MAAKKAAKKTAAKKASSKKASSKTSAAGKTASSKKAASTKTAVKKSAAKKAPAKKTAAKKAASKRAKKAVVKSKLDKKFVEAQRKLLVEERARYLSNAEAFKQEADALMEGREPGDVQFDEESGEGDTLAVERERDLALSAHARAAVEEIDAALDRIKAGTYGVCTGSGKPIPKERLKAIPWAAECVEYKVAGFRR